MLRLDHLLDLCIESFLLDSDALLLPSGCFLHYASAYCGPRAGGATGTPIASLEGLVFDNVSQEVKVTCPGWDSL